MPASARAKRTPSCSRCPRAPEVAKCSAVSACCVATIAAIATGWRLMIEELGIDEADIAQVLLAGSFGSYLSAASAIRIGLVPKLPIPRIISAGNVAGEGAKMAILSIQERHAGAALIEYTSERITQAEARRRERLRPKAARLDPTDDTAYNYLFIANDKTVIDGRHEISPARLINHA